MTDTTANAFDTKNEAPSDFHDWLGALFTLVPILRRYWWIVLMVALFVTALAGIYLFTRIEQYRASATIVLTPGLGQKNDSDLSDIGGPKDMGVFTNTQLQLLRSNDVIDQAIVNCHANTWPEFAELDPTQLEKKISLALDIQMPSQTALMTVATLSPDPEHAMSLVNAVCASYLEKCKNVMHVIRGERYNQQQSAGESPQVQYLTICRKVDDFMRDNEITPDQTTNPYLAQMQDMTSVKDDADRAVAVVQQQADQALQAEKAFAARTSSLPPADLNKPENDVTEMLMLPRVLIDPTIQKMTQDIFTQEGTVAGFQASLGPDNQSLRGQQELLWTLRRIRRQQVQSSLDGLNLELALAKQKAAEIDTDFAEVKTRSENWRNSLIQLNDLLRQKREAESTYEDVRTNSDRSQILSRMDLLPASTWSEASLPTQPYDQQILLKLIGSLLLGLVLGVLSAVGYDRMDASIRTREDLVRYIHPTLLGSIPFAQPKEYGTEVVKISVHYPSSPVAEAFRTIRTSLSIALPKTAGRARVMMMTSSIPSEGKSSCCCNLSAILAQNNARVLLIDADLRRPTLHHSLELSGDIGLAEYLAKDLDPQSIVQNSHALGVDVITSGHPPINPSELLSTPRFASLLEWARGRYDWIVLDTPPVVPVTDARIMAEQVDGIILVVRSFFTPRPIVQRGMELVRETHAPILGLICNNAEGYELGHYVKGFGYSSYTTYGAYKYSKYTPIVPISEMTGTSKSER